MTLADRLRERKLFRAVAAGEQAADVLRKRPRDGGPAAFGANVSGIQTSATS
jgi:hypothetical protein